MTYKTAAELGISQAEHDALVELVPYFRTKVCTIPDHDLKGIGSSGVSAIDGIVVETELGFHMNHGAGLARDEKKYDCGCIACIGGHVSLRMQGLAYGTRLFTGPQLRRANGYVMDHDPRDSGDFTGLNGLFFPNNVIVERDWDKIRPDLASDAIENFLTRGEADWESIAKANDLTIVGSADDDEDA